MSTEPRDLNEADGSVLSDDVGAIGTSLLVTPKADMQVVRYQGIDSQFGAASAKTRAAKERQHLPLSIEPASVWADREPPLPRDWVIEGLSIGAGRVTSYLSNGGFGKTQTAIQIGIAVATNQPIWGMQVRGGPVLAILCEDEQAEIERRGRAICLSDGIDLSALDRFHALSRDGEQNLLCTFERDAIVLTDFYYQLDATISSLKPRLTILDTAADVFGGDFQSTPHVRQFIKVALGGLCKRHGTAVLLLAHPSAAAMASGDGAGFSVAWHNSVRSRLYMRKPKSDDAEATADRRVVEVKKSNYGPSGASIPLIYQSGRFVLDPSPIDEGSTLKARSAKVDTAMSIAILDFMRASPACVITFGSIFDYVAKLGLVGLKNRESSRKQVSRCLRAMCDAGIVRAIEVPRGSYRIV